MYSKYRMVPFIYVYIQTKQQNQYIYIFMDKFYISDDIEIRYISPKYPWKDTIQYIYL